MLPGPLFVSSGHRQRTLSLLRRRWSPGDLRYSRRYPFRLPACTACNIDTHRTMHHPPPSSYPSYEPSLLTRPLTSASSSLLHYWLVVEAIGPSVDPTYESQRNQQSCCICLCVYGLPVTINKQLNIIGRW
jgi:hypothetical protein